METGRFNKAKLDFSLASEGKSYDELKVLIYKKLIRMLMPVISGEEELNPSGNCIFGGKVVHLHSPKSKTNFSLYTPGSFRGQPKAKWRLTACCESRSVPVLKRDLQAFVRVLNY